MQKIAVIGLGRFGTSLARRLASSGVSVIAIDRNGHLVAEIKDDVDVAVRLDSTDKTAMLAQGIDKVDVCVVSIGENFEAALLTTVLVRQLEVPLVICRAQSEFHAQIFEQIGADRVIQPEREAGNNLARQLANPQLVDFIRLGEGFTLIEFRAPEEFQGKSLKSLALRTRYDVNLVVIKRTIPSEKNDAPPRDFFIVPKPDELIQPDDILVVVGPDDSLARLPKE
ncbi:Ktr system potassium uptake protein A [Maioricimonas rarisocia]|uniref:Ktr system potassium uptake protein A n=1 Tax=Maioricimonas rarisocia TaxID=2528026 RepID=A0A517ZCI2_9PLAN|nr:TrkA family potassium uptake protein [Maioricimonas rarisocia]QDU40204.1 Ktr system potassium uptake protein A [Maioricimonas rarisocia]